MACILGDAANAQIVADWNANVSGNWSDATKWNGGVPNAAGDTANFTINIDGTRTITIDALMPSTTAIVGIINFADPNGTNAWTIAGGTLVFNNDGSPSQINMAAGGNTNTISSSVTIVDPLQISVADTSNNQGLTISGAISGGTNGSETIVFDDTSTTGQNVNWLLLSGNNSFLGQLVANSGLIRLESNNNAAGQRGVGNETIARNGGSIDLRDRDFNTGGVDDTEIFILSGAGTNGLGALRNTAGNANLSHIVLAGDATVGGYSRTDMIRHTDSNGDEVAPILDFNNQYFLSKLGSTDFVIRNGNFINRTNGTTSGGFNIYEGELRLENNGGLVVGSVTGTDYGNHLDGLTINLAYNRNAHDGSDPANGTRTSDPFNVNVSQSGTSGNSVLDARLSFGTYWGNHAANTKVVETYDNFTVNFNNGVWQREGNSDVGRTFDQIFGAGVVINFVGAGIGRNATGNGNLFDMQSGSGSYNSTLGAFDHPGVTEIGGTFDNTSPGNNGTGFTVRGSRELRITGNNTAFDGDILIKQSTGRWITNSFDRSNGGQAASTYTNMSLAGADGSFNQANSITITRWGSLALRNNASDPLYASANHDDRLNDNGFLNMRNGFLVLETDATTTNKENLGNVVADLGTNYLYLDTRAGGLFDGSFQTFTRNNEGVLKIYDTNPTHTWGTGATDDRLAIMDTTGLVMVGADAAGTDTQRVVLGLFGGVVPTLLTPTISSHTRPLESVQGSFMYSGGGTGLMTLESTVDGDFLRPLTSSEYNTGTTPTSGTNWLINSYIAPITGTENYADRNNYAARNVTGDVTINSLTVSLDLATTGQPTPTSTKDYVIIQPGKTLTISSGIINFVNFTEATSANLETVIRGGALDMDGQVAFINSNALWQDTDRDTPNWYELMSGNSSFMRSHITNATGLVKTGRSSLYLETSNNITGNIYVSEQSSLYARHTGALGAGAAGREVVIGGGGNFLLEYGTNITGIDIRATNSIDTGGRVMLRNEGTTHSTWGGNVILDVADAAGSWESQNYAITARSNGTLTLYGDIYTDNNSNFTDSDAYVDPAQVTTSIGETYTLNLRGQFRDVATGNVGTDPAYGGALTSIRATGDAAIASQGIIDRNHSLRFQMSGHDEGNVNVFQQWDATGRLDLRQGYFRVLYDPTGYTGATDGGFYTDGARALITPNDYWNRAVIGADGSSSTNAYHSHLMLTQDGQVFNAPYLYAYNDNRNGTLTIGGENTSGTVYYGSRDNSVNFSMQFVNQSTLRDIRFLQVRGGSMVWNGRLDDENGTVGSFDSSVSIVGPGTVTFNRNAIGNSDIDRWNFMAGETHWGVMTGNDQFASNSTDPLAGQSSWGGGGLVLDAQGTARSQQLNSHIWMFNGSSHINTQNNTTLILGSASSSLTRNTGSSLAFMEDGNGAINISANGLTTTDGDFLGAWAVYGTSAGITDWAAREGTTGVKMFTAYSNDSFGVGNHTNLTGAGLLGADANTSTLRFGAAVGLDLGGNVLTLDEGGILVPSTNAGAVSISNGTLTSGYTTGSTNDLMVHNHGTGGLTISAVIDDHATAKVNLVNAGNGTTILTADNTYTGETFLNGGVLEISSGSQLGAISGSVVRLARVNVGSNNGTNQSGAALIFTTDGFDGGATGTFNSNNTSGGQVTATTITSGGSGYTNGIWVNTNGTGSAGIWAILDSGNLHFDGGTLRVTNDITLDGARTIFLGGNGGTLDVAAGKSLTINGYITSELSHVTADNGFTVGSTSVDHIGGSDTPASDRNPDIGDLIIEGGGTVILTGAPDNNVRSNMFNSYGGITWINNGTLKIASAGSSSAAILGTNRSWVDGTVIGVNGSMEFAATSDPSMFDWLTFRGMGYEGRGTLISTGTARSIYLRGQMFVESDMLINNTNSSTFRLGDGGGALYGTGNIARTGNGEFYIYVNAPDWTGKLLNGSGNVRFYGSGSLQGTSGIELSRNTYLGYGAGSTTTDEFRDRLPDDLVAATNGYVRMRMEAGAGVFSGVEKAGTVTVEGGVLGIEYDLGTDIVLGALRQQGDYAGWRFEDIIRTPGSVVQVRSFDPGSDISSGVTDLNNRALLLVDNSATVLNTLVGGDGTNKNDMILPGFFGGARPTYLNSTTGVAWDEDRISRFLMTAVAGTDPISGDAVTYLRPLAASDYFTVANPGTDANSAVDLATAGISADQNVRFVGMDSDGIDVGELTATRNSTLNLGTTLTVNSLSFGATLHGNGVNGVGENMNMVMDREGRLVISSGVLMVAQDGIQNRQGASSDTGRNLVMNTYMRGGQLDFSGKEAIIYAGSEWTQYNVVGNLNAFANTDTDNTSVFFYSNIRNTGGNGLTKTGASSVFLEAANSYTGDTTVNMGNLYARHDAAFGQSTRLNVTGSGNFIIGGYARISGVDLYVGPLNGNNLALYAENEGAQWGGDVIIDNVDAAGRAGGFTRNFVPRIEIASSSTVFHIDGDIYGGDTAVVPGTQGNSRIFSTYTDATNSVLNLRGQIKDKSTGAIGAPVTSANQNDVLRMEITGGNNLVTVHTHQQYDSAGRIQFVRGVLRYMGEGNFYTDAAAAALNPDNEMSGLQMGGRSLFSSAGTGSADVALWLNRAGTTFNLASWNVGVDTADATNSTGNGNYGLGNTTGNSTIGGENTSGTVTFGTGAGSIRFTQADTAYDRNLNLFAARGGTVDMRVNFLDGGDLVNSSVTKKGAGTMNLLGSSAGDSTVEALKMLGGTLNLTGYDVNAYRRVGNGAALTLSGGFLVVDATAGTAAQEDFGDFTLNSGGSRLAALGDATVNINATNAISPAPGVTLAFIEGGAGIINITAPGLTATDGARFGSWAVYGNALGQVSDWAARDGTTGVKAFQGYTANTFTTGTDTHVTAGAVFGGNMATGSVKFSTGSAINLGGNTFTVESGGILVGFGTAGTASIDNGTLTRSGAGDVSVHNYGTLTISANIVDDGVNKVNFVAGGTGTTVLTGTNTYTGNTFINGGVLEISSDSQLGAINGSIVRLVRENSGSNANNGGNLIFATANAPTTAATGTYAGSTSVSSTTLVSGGSGYTTGIHVSPNSNPNSTDAGIWAILDSGNIHLDGGTLRVTDNVILDGARTIFLGASSGTFEVAAGKTLTINGYITSDITDWPSGDTPVDATSPFVGGFSVEGGGTVVITGAPDNTARNNMYNGYNSLTSINNGTVRISSTSGTASNALGTYGGWADSTYIGPNGSLEINVTNADPALREWLTLDGQGYQGGGTIISYSRTATVRATYLRGQINVVQDAVFNLRNGSNLYLNSGGGEIFGSGDIIKIGNGDFRFYGNSPYWTGGYIGSAGTTRVYDYGYIQGMSSMTLERNSYFGHDANSTTWDETRDRLPDVLPITTDGYVRMRMEATGGVFSGIEKTGVVTVAGGNLSIEYDLGSTLAGGAPNLTNDYAGWHFADIVRTPGTTVQVRNFDFGTDFANKDFNLADTTLVNDNLDLSNRAVLQIDSTATVLNTLIGGDGTNGNAKILPGFFGGTRPGWIGTDGSTQRFNEDYTANRLMTADTNANGEMFIRPLYDSEYKEVSNPDTAQTTTILLEEQGINPDQNLKIVGVITDSLGSGEFTNRRNSFLTLGSVDPSCVTPAGTNLVVNSLTFSSESFVDGSGSGRGNWTALVMTDGAKLTISSGVIQVYNTGIQNRNGSGYDGNINMDIRSSINGGQVDFNGKEAIFNIGSIWVHYNTSDSVGAYRATDFDNNYLFFNSSIVNATGLTKTGGASLILGAPNYYTGLTAVNHGALYARHDQALGYSTQVNVTGAGTFVLGHGARIAGVDLYVAKIQDNRTALQIENTSVWAGNVIIDNVDSAGATSYGRNFTPRIFNNTTGTGTIEGNIYGGSTPIGSGALTDSRMFSTYTGAFGLLDIRGQVRDTATGAITGPIDIYNQSQVLRMEVTANNNESAVQLVQHHDAAGRIRLLRGSLYYAGTGDFYTTTAAATVNSAPLNPMLGFQMGGRSILATDGGEGAANLGFFLLNAGSNFNLKSWEVGVETHDPENRSGNDNWGRGNTTGNSTIGGVNLSGTVTFGTGDGSVFFTQTDRQTSAYDRDLGLFAARGGQVTFRTNFVDGGSMVNSSITKLGGGQVNLLGSSAGYSTVEAVNVMGGILNLAGYDVNTSRRVGSGAALTLAGGVLAMDGSGASFTENFSSLTLRQGGNGIAALGNGAGNAATVSIAGSSISRLAAATVHFQSIAGGVVNFTNAAMQNVARIGSYATFGANASTTPFATDWAATDGSGNVIAFTGYDASNVDVISAIAGGAVNSLRFNTTAGSISSGAVTLADGGILVTSNYSTGTIVDAGVTVTTGAAATDLLIHNYATGPVTFDGIITGSQNVVFSGTGNTVLNTTTSTVDTTVSSTTASNSYTITVDTTGLTPGMEVSGTNIKAGTKIVSITDATHLVISLLPDAAGTNDLVYSTRSYAATNTYNGATHVLGDATVAFNAASVFGSTSAFLLNGGTLNYTGTIASEAITQSVTLGGGNGTIMVSDPAGRLVLRLGTGTNQFSSETDNIISSYGTNNPNAGGLTLLGSGTIQFGDRSAANNVTDNQGIRNNYTGLTIIGDGVNALRVDIQGQPNDGNSDATIFGTTESWADATIVRNNATVEFSSKRGDGSRDGQFRIREWFQIGEQAGDQILFDGSTQRQPTLDGVLNIIGDLTFGTQGNRYGDAGGTGNSEFLINPNEGGVFGTGDIIKLGDGNLRFYNPLHEWTGDLDLRDGITYFQVNSGAIFNPTGTVYLGDPTGSETSLTRVRAENRHYGNNTTGIDSPNFDLTFNRDIIVRDNIRQEVRIEAGYQPQGGVLHFTNSINVGSGSSSFVRLYYEDNNQLDASIVGHVQHTVFDITGNISGSNTVWIDNNNSGGTPTGRGALFTVWMKGDNSGYSGRFIIGGDGGTTYNPGRSSILRLGSTTALGTDTTIDFRNGGILQVGGMDFTLTQDFRFIGGAGLYTTAAIENASSTEATITFHSTQTGTSYQDVGIGLRDGVTPSYFGSSSAVLNVVKTGAGNTYFGASTGGVNPGDFSSYTGTTTVQEGTLFAASFNALSPYSRFIIAGGATLSLNPADVGSDNTIGSLSGSAGATVDIDNSFFRFGGDNTLDADYSGTIVGPSASGFVKVGSGMQRLSGVNTFSAAVAVAQGTLIGGNNAAFGSSGNTIYLGGVTFAGPYPTDAFVQLLLDGSANAIDNPVEMNWFDGNYEGVSVIGTRELTGTYGFTSSGTVLLAGNLFVRADGASTLQLGGVISENFGTEQLIKIGSGTVELLAANNVRSFSDSSTAAIEGGVVLREGTVVVTDPLSLGNAVVEMGDRTSSIAEVDLATTQSLFKGSSSKASFDEDSNGISDSGGAGAFLNVNAEVDGVPLTLADVGKRILVKDEGSDPERNGVYEIVTVDEDCKCMSLTRVADFNEATEMLYGTTVAVTGGATQTGLSFFMASQDVTTVNGDGTDPLHWLQVSADASVALLSSVDGLDISNWVDVNATNGAGTTTLGGSSSLITGGSTFSGNITLQNVQSGTAESKTLALTSSTSDGNGVLFTGVMSEADTTSGTGDTLSVEKVGSGTVTLQGANTYRGTTTVSEGILRLDGGNGGSLGGTAVTVADGAILHIMGDTTIGTSGDASITLAPGATTGGVLSLQDGAINTLTLDSATAGHDALILGSGAGMASLLYDVDASIGVTDLIAVQQRMLLNGGGASIGLNTIAGTVLADGLYDLITFSAGSTALGGFLFGDGTGTLTFAGGTNFFAVNADTTYSLVWDNGQLATEGNFEASTTKLQLLVGDATGFFAYWTGDQDSSWSTDIAGDTNFATMPDGATDLGAVPTPIATVYMTADSAANSSTTTLDGDFTIQGLVFTDGTTTASTNDVTIAPGTGGTLTLNSGGISDLSTTAAHTITADIILGANQTWTNSSSGALTIDGDTITGTGNLSISGSGNTVINADIQTGGGTLSKYGMGTLTLAGDNTYTGVTTINGGTVLVTSATGLGDTVGGTTVNAGGTLTLANLTITESLILNGTGVGGNGALIGTGTSEVTGTVNLASTSSVGTPGAGDTLTLSGVVSGTGDLVKVGDGTLVLTEANTYGGATQVNEGILNVRNSSGLGTADGSAASGTTVSTGTTLQVQGNLSIGNESLVLNGTGATGQNGALVNVSGSKGFGGTVTLATDATIASDSGTLTLNNTTAVMGTTQTLTVTGAGNTTISGAVSNGTGGVKKEGSGTLTLSGANTYTGDTTVNSGTVVLQNGSAIADTGAVVMADTTGAQLQLNASETIGSLSGGGSTGGNVNLQGNALTVAGSSNTTYSGSLSGTGGSLAKSGSGALTLAGTSTYTGSTSVTGGTLHVTGALTGTSGVTVNGGTSLAAAPVLSGNGSISGPVVIGTGVGSVGILKPGPTSGGSDNGTLTISSAGTALTVATGSQIQLGISAPTLVSNAFAASLGGSGTTALAYLTANPSEASAWNTAPANATDHDYINLTGSLSDLSVGDRASPTYGDGSILVSGSFTAELGQVFNLIDWTALSNIMGSFDVGPGTFYDGTNPVMAGDLDLPALGNGFVWDVSAFRSHGILVVVPEPNRAALLLISVLCLASRRRRPRAA